MKKGIFTLLLALGMLLLTVPVNAATVDKSNFHFSDMHLKRIWFQNMDPIFKVDHYEPVELAEGLNITGIGDLTNVTEGEASDGFLAPMKSFFQQIGGTYEEDGDTVTMTLNGDTLVMTVDSTEVILNGVGSEALPEESKPKRINIAEHPVFGPANPLVASDLEVVYLPTRYILEAFQAAIYWDEGQSSIYAVMKILKNESDTIPNPDKQGSRFDQILSIDVIDKKETAEKIAKNIVDLQNKDGGFMNLDGDVDMAQDQLISKIGSKRNSSIEEIANGQVSTVTELRFLANMIEAYPDEADRYILAFDKGIQYLLDAQLDNGGWALQKDGVGYYSTISYADNAMVDVLTLFNDIARLNDQNYVFFRENNQEVVTLIDQALELGINNLVNSQIVVNGERTGWSSHHHPVDLVPVIGKTYEREGINAAETTRIAEFLMHIRLPSEEVKKSIESAVAWLDKVKISDKKMKTVIDITMNNGIERFLVDEADHITWARNYKTSDAGFKPFFSDRQLDRGDIPLMNFDPDDPRDVIGIPEANKYYSNYNVATDATPKIMFYETRTAYEWYVDTPKKLLETDYKKWKKHLENGWPPLPVDPEEPQNGKINIKPVLSGDIAKATASKESLKAAFKQAPKVKGVQIVEVLLEKISGAKIYELTIPTEFLTKGGKNERIQLSTEFGTLLLEGHMLTNAKVKDEMVTISIAAGKTDKGKPSIELGLHANGKSVKYNHPGAPAEILIPYEPTAEELKNPKNIGVVYINDVGKRTLVKSVKYDDEKGGVIFTVNHFGQFEVVHQ